MYEYDTESHLPRIGSRLPRIPERKLPCDKPPKRRQFQKGDLKFFLELTWTPKSTDNRYGIRPKPKD